MAAGNIVFTHYQSPCRFFLLIHRLGFLGDVKLENAIYNPQYSKINPEGKTILTVGIPQIEHLANPEIILNQVIIDFINRHNNTHLLYDISIESLTDTNYISGLLLQFHDLLKKNNIDPKRVALLCSNANSEKFYENWIEKNNYQHYKIQMLGYYFYLYEYFWEIMDCNWIQENFQRIVQTAKKTVEQGIKRNKYFMCLNLRPRQHRTAILLHFLDRNILNKGLVTYFGDEFAEHPSVDKKNQRIEFISRLKSKERLIKQMDNLEKITPLILNKDATGLKKQLWDRTPGQVEFLFPEGNDFFEKNTASYFEIVTETWFTNGINSYLTEKTIRPILRLQPFIHVGAPHILKVLRSMGFKTFSPFIDETYDDIEDPYQRIEYIFTEIDRLCAMSLDQIHELYCQLWNNVLHNFQFYTTRLLKVAEDDINKNIFSKLLV